MGIIDTHSPNVFELNRSEFPTEFDRTIWTTLLGRSDDIRSGSIDLRQEMSSILENHGHYAFLRKAVDPRPPSYDHKTLESDTTDPYAWKNHMYEDHLMKIRIRPAMSVTAIGMQSQLMPFGTIVSREYVCYLPWDANPSVRDGIIEVTLDSNGKPTFGFNIERVYEIESTHPYRESNGRIEFWIASLRQSIAGK